MTTSQTLQTMTLAAPLQLLILPRAYAVPPVGIASGDQTPMTINDLTQAMVDPDEKVRARAQNASSRRSPLKLNPPQPRPSRGGEARGNQPLQEG